MTLAEQAEMVLRSDPQQTPDPPWAHLPDEELLKYRICDLKIRIQGSELEPIIHKFYAELDEKNVYFHPACYLTTEWLTPDLVPIIGIPFCLAHPRLKQLEKTMMMDVEGGTEASCLKLLRHEAGHAFNYAYKFYRRTRWRELFGPFTLEYNVQDYYPRPYSRQYVVHLEDNYAQAHPDEDFAETFAVWLTPGVDWRRKYQGWGALKKLEYVDHLMQTNGTRPPLVRRGKKLWPVSRVRATLESYYKRKRIQFADGYPAYYDPDLRRLFCKDGDTNGVTAASFLSRNRRHLTNIVAQWTHMPKYAVDHLIRRLIQRSRELALYLPGPEEQVMVPVSVYLTSVMCDKRERRRQGEDGAD